MFQLLLGISVCTETLRNTLATERETSGKILELISSISVIFLEKISQFYNIRLADVQIQFSLSLENRLCSQAKLELNWKLEERSE